jgi:hypothetical protein
MLPENAPHRIPTAFRTAPLFRKNETRFAYTVPINSIKGNGPSADQHVDRSLGACRPNGRSRHVRGMPPVYSLRHPLGINRQSAPGFLRFVGLKAEIHQRPIGNKWQSPTFFPFGSFRPAWILVGSAAVLIKVHFWTFPWELIAVLPRDTRAAKCIIIGASVARQSKHTDR